MRPAQLVNSRKIGSAIEEVSVDGPSERFFWSNSPASFGWRPLRGGPIGNMTKIDLRTVARFSRGGILGIRATILLLGILCKFVRHTAASFDRKTPPIKLAPFNTQGHFRRKVAYYEQHLFFKKLKRVSHPYLAGYPPTAVS